MKDPPYINNHTMQIADLLGPLEAERISILFSPENLKVRNLSISFFSFKLPLEPTHSRTSCKCLIFKPLPGVKAENLLVALLWEAVFGKKFKVYHWYVLFNVLIRTINKDKNSEALLSILVILTANAATTRWNSNLKPMKSIFRRIYGTESHQFELEKLLNNLPYRLPRKSEGIENFMQITEGMFKLEKPKELARIGVGYKDKGSLSSEKVDPELQTFQFFIEKEEFFDVLLRQVQLKYSNLIID